MEIIQSPSPNFSSRHGRPIVGIVNHVTAGPYPGCRDWLCNPKAEASAHYIVTRTGLIVQLVPDELASWHAGIVQNTTWPLYELHNRDNPNWLMIGIEHEDYDGDGELGLTELQYQATLWLHKILIQKHGIPIDTDHIIGHYRINPVQRPYCPGPYFPWQRLFGDLTIISVNVAVGGQVLQGIIFPDAQGNPRSFVPVRAISQILGFQYGWRGVDGENGFVIIGSYQVPVKIVNSTGYAKVNDLCAAIGRQVVWDGSTNTVRIV